jgi:hypothetical protein
MLDMPIVYIELGYLVDIIPNTFFFFGENPNPTEVPLKTNSRPAESENSQNPHLSYPYLPSLHSSHQRFMGKGVLFFFVPLWSLSV